MQLLVLGVRRSGDIRRDAAAEHGGSLVRSRGHLDRRQRAEPQGFLGAAGRPRHVRCAARGGGFDWWRVSKFDLDAIPETVRENQLKVFRKIVLQLDAHRPWVLKEPRLCLLLPLLKPALEVPIFIHVVREPLEVAACVHARSGFSRPATLGLWELYTIRSLEASAGMPRLLVRYDELTADPVATTTRLLDELADLGVQGLHRPTEREITTFITPDLYHQRRSAEVRGLHLNQQQAQIAAAIDDGTVFDAPLPAARVRGRTRVDFSTSSRTRTASRGSVTSRSESPPRRPRLTEQEPRAPTTGDRLHRRARAGVAARVAPAVAEESAATQGLRGARQPRPGWPSHGPKETSGRSATPGRGGSRVS